jgi:DNA-binding transcriptional MerR regulator
MPELPATRITIDGPQLRADQSGYVLGEDFVDGFADRPDLGPVARRRIAGWAQAFGHDLDDRQRALLEAPEPEDGIGLALLDAAVRNADVDLPLAARFGLYDRLTDEERSLVREPWRALRGPERRDYPLNVAELAQLTGATAKQLRDWETATLLPAARIDGRRQFFSAAVVHAFALRRLDRFQVAALASLQGTGDDVFADLLEHALAARRRRSAAAEDAGAEAAPGVTTAFVDRVRALLYSEVAAGEVVLDTNAQLQDLIVRPLAGRGWTFSTDLGLEVSRKDDAVRIGKAVASQLGGGVRILSKHDGQVVHPRAANRRQRA